MGIDVLERRQTVFLAGRKKCGDQAKERRTWQMEVGQEVIDTQKRVGGANEEVGLSTSCFFRREVDCRKVVLDGSHGSGSIG